MLDDLVAFLRARYDDREQKARAAARAVGEHHYAPIEAPMHDDTSARWDARRWLFQKKVTAVGRPDWRDEGPKVTDSVYREEWKP